jgi:hypothetical protein
MSFSKIKYSTFSTEMNDFVAIFFIPNDILFVTQVFLRNANQLKPRFVV